MSQPPPPTREQARAVAELAVIARQLPGTLAVDQSELESTGELFSVRVWLWTGPQLRGQRGVRLDDWEGVDIWIPPDFPFQMPSVRSVHSRFSSLPYILWERGICLYLSPADWVPSDGMGGFLKRLIDFYKRLASGSLQGPMVPWHPPVARASRLGGTVVVREDLVIEDRHREEAFLRWAISVPAGPDRVDIVEWLDTGDLPGLLDDLENWSNRGLDLYGRHLERHGGLLVPVVVLPEPISFTYPSDLQSLRRSIEVMGVAELDITRRLRYAREVNAAFHDAAAAVHDEVSTGLDASSAPLLLLRAPATRRRRATDRRAHFAGWRVLPHNFDDSRQTMLADESSIAWAHVYDARHDAVVRRDAGRPVSQLARKQVLVLGCGALGAPIAEHCLRAGAEKVHLVDDGRVTPGLLVRQPYEEQDIGQHKAVALARQLGRVRPGDHIEHHVADAVDLMDSPWCRAVDLIVDATANPAVRSKIERVHVNGVRRAPDLLTVGIGQDARVGVAALTPSGTIGAGVDLLRRLRLESVDYSPLADTMQALFPQRDKRQVFQPEPGCSDPTFVGSTTDVSGLAAQLLDSALEDLVNAPQQVTASGAVQPVRRSLCVITTRPHLSRTYLAIAEDRRLRDERGAYDIRLEPRALEQIHRAVLKDDGEAHPSWGANETGGSLLGQFDDASGVVWVSRAPPPTAGSVGTHLGFTLDTPATDPEMQDQQKRSGGLLTFIGAWHTHPNGPATPSGTDVATMTALVEGPMRRALLLILAPREPGDTTDEWSPEIYAEIFTN